MPPQNRQLEERIREIIREELENQRLEKDIDIAVVTDEQVREIIREEVPHLLKKTTVAIEGNIQLLDGRNIMVGSTNGTKIGTSTAQKLGFFNKTPVVQPSALTAQLASLTHTEPSTPDYAIQDLTNSSPYGFVTKDEGNTVLKVIKNLQTRVQELETKLESLGIIAQN
jgi:hypothetical protein